MKHTDKNVNKTNIRQHVSVGADLGGGDTGLAARQLLAETVISAGATFTDEFGRAGKTRGAKGSGKGKQRGRQDLLMLLIMFVVLMSLGSMGHTFLPRQATEEEAEAKEMNKDLTAITNLVSACRAASLSLSKLEHTSEMQTDLKVRLEAVKAHQEKMENMVFGNKPRVSKHSCAGS